MRFNPHTHEGCDVIPRIFPTSVAVSIHTPTKGVTGVAFGWSSQAKVSIHTPTKGVTLHSCEVNIRDIVSIHTPTKGVTGLNAVADKNDIVSIHTPTKGVTLHRWHLDGYERGFNPHTHEGCDFDAKAFQTDHPEVSIHTPTKGVTAYSANG